MADTLPVTEAVIAADCEGEGDEETVAEARAVLEFHAEPVGAGDTVRDFVVEEEEEGLSVPEGEGVPEPETLGDCEKLALPETLELLDDKVGPIGCSHLSSVLIKVRPAVPFTVATACGLPV